MRTEKKTPQHKSTYTIDTTCNRGNISSTGKQPSGPVPFAAPVTDLLHSVAVQSVQRQFGRGGVMSVIGEGTRASRCSVLSQG